MATYTLTVSTNALGLGVLNGAKVRIEKRRVAIADTYPPINNLIQIAQATNSSGIATFLLQPDDLTTYHVAKIFDTAGIFIYERFFSMPPSATSLDNTVTGVLFGNSNIQFKDEGNNRGTPSSVRNVDFVCAGVEATFEGDTLRVFVQAGSQGFQTTYNPQITGQFPTTANTVDGVAIKKGFTWVVSGVTGQYTFQGVTVDNGDTLLALVDNASATSAADWHITEKNLGYTPENQSNKVNDLTDSTSTTKYTSVKAVVDGLETKEPTITTGSSTQYIRGDKTLATLDAAAVTETEGRVYLSPEQKTVATQAASTSTNGYLTSTDWDTFNSKLGLADVRYVFLNDSTTTQTTYTVPASAVTENGRIIVELSHSGLGNITVNPSSSTGKIAGDSVNITVTGDIGSQTIVSSDVTLEGDPIFSYKHQTKTLIFKGGTTWKIVG